jgi:hypothetical protein
MKCRLFGKGIGEIKGWLTRVNEKGVKGIWECKPFCGANLTEEQSLLGAITEPSKEFPNDN